MKYVMPKVYKIKLIRNSNYVVITRAQKYACKYALKN